MKRTQYLEKRKEMLNQAQTFLDEGKFEELKSKKAEIEKLDEDFETISKEQANIAALEGKVSVLDLSNQSVNPQGASVIGTLETPKQIDYESVFAKVALKRELNAQEIYVFNQYNPENEYTHTTENTDIMIPKTVVAGIIDTMKQLHPILEDVIPTNIKGTVKYTKHTKITAGDADYYDEASETQDEQNEFGELVLTGKELSKAITVTWKLQAMAIDEFIPFLQAELGRRMGYAKANAFINGKGDTKYPQGVITAIKAEVSTPQKVEYTAQGLKYTDLTSAMAKLKSMYMNGAKVYANNQTVWNTLANVTDEKGRPIFIPDVTTGGVGRVFGIPVKEEDGLKDGEILIANMAQGYKENVQESMKLVTEQHAKGRKTDFVGYEVHDGGVIDTGAFVYVVKGV